MPFRSWRMKQALPIALATLITADIVVVVGWSASFKSLPPWSPLGILAKRLKSKSEE